MGWNSDALGGIEDDVQLKIGDAGTLYLAESYDVRQAFFTSSPNVWAVRLGVATGQKQLLELTKPRTPIELYVGGTLQQTGWSDGYEADADANGGTTVTMHGRDAMADLHDAYVRADRHFKNMSFLELTNAVLTEAVGPNFTLFDKGNSGNRLKATGGSNTPAAKGNAPAVITPALTSAQGKDLRAKFGEKWRDFLGKQLGRAGIFLITGVAGEFILCAPDTKQKPMCRILRESGKTRNMVSVRKARLKNTSTTRFAFYEVHGRKGGTATNGIAIPPDAPEDVKAALIAAAATGSKRMSTSFADPEMVAWGYPPSRAYAHKDPNATSVKQALFYARKRCAEDRRANWQLSYEVSGHTTPALGSGKRVTWAIDTMVEVYDEDFGINGNFWIESVQFKRDSNGTTTNLVLMRPEDLIFGEPSP